MTLGGPCERAPSCSGQLRHHPRPDPAGCAGGEGPIPVLVPIPRDSTSLAREMTSHAQHRAVSRQVSPHRDELSLSRRQRVFFSHPSKTNRAGRRTETSLHLRSGGSASQRSRNRVTSVRRDGGVRAARLHMRRELQRFIELRISAGRAKPGKARSGDGQARERRQGCN
ncbi:uncharacterized protein ACIBXB_011690 [Morphnus guianensis]